MKKMLLLGWMIMMAIPLSAAVSRMKGLTRGDFLLTLYTQGDTRMIDKLTRFGQWDVLGKGVRLECFINREYSTGLGFLFSDHVEHRAISYGEPNSLGWYQVFDDISYLREKGAYLFGSYHLPWLRSNRFDPTVTAGLKLAWRRDIRPVTVTYFPPNTVSPGDWKYNIDRLEQNTRILTAWFSIGLNYWLSPGVALAAHYVMDFPISWRSTSNPTGSPWKPDNKSAISLGIVIKL